MTRYERLKASKFSLVDIFGTLPIDPDRNKDFQLLPMDQYLLGECEEGKHFCTNCFTTTPELPKTHHEKCFSYSDDEAFGDGKLNALDMLCPCCHSEFLGIDSNVDMGMAVISCADCDLYESYDMCEVDAISEFKKTWK